jgi:hypothetical protein
MFLFLSFPNPDVAISVAANLDVTNLVVANLDVAVIENEGTLKAA